jgi:sec-independent protein translocase protein TatB
VPLNLSFTHLMVVLVVALVVLGPDKLPDAVRTVAKWVGEARRLTSGLQAEMRETFSDFAEPISELVSTMGGSAAETSGLFRTAVTAPPAPSEADAPSAAALPGAALPGAPPPGTVPFDTGPLDTGPLDIVPLDTVPLDTVPPLTELPTLEGAAAGVGFVPAPDLPVAGGPLTELPRLPGAPDAPALGTFSPGDPAFAGPTA